MTDTMEHPLDTRSESRCRVVVAGVGGGAGHVLDRVLEYWVNPPTVALINTDERALDDSTVPLKVTIGKSVAKGMGTGGDSELGRLAAHESTDALRALVAGNDLLLLVAGLGGGTATGVAPVVAQIAREEGLLVLAFVTLPFTFEGDRRNEQAQEGLKALKQSADAVVCLPNQRLYSILEKDTSLPDAFAHVDRMMSAGIRSLWTLLVQNNMINLDFSDLQSLVENSGNECAFGYGEGSGPNKAADALAALLEGPMLEKGRVLANAGAMILSVAGGPDLSLAELEMIQQRFRKNARADARISIGAAVLPDWTGHLALTALVVEHWIPPARHARPGALILDVSAPPSSAEPPPAGRAKKGVKQSELQLDAPPDVGRFRDVNPTIYNGEDLDIPVFIRRNMRISS